MSEKCIGLFNKYFKHRCIIILRPFTVKGRKLLCALSVDFTFLVSETISTIEMGALMMTILELRCEHNIQVNECKQ